MPSDLYRRKAETLLRKAAETQDMKDRGQLIMEAMRWHQLAVEAHQHGVAKRKSDRVKRDET